jgi:hypothetical protein
MLDKFLVLVALIALLAFCGVVIVFVAEPDLVIVMILMLALATHDFWISVFKPIEQAPDEDLPLEALPTGVSGKPMPAKKKPAGRKKASQRSSKK